MTIEEAKREVGKRLADLHAQGYTWAALDGAFPVRNGDGWRDILSWTPFAHEIDRKLNDQAN